MLCRSGQDSDYLGIVDHVSHAGNLSDSVLCELLVIEVRQPTSQQEYTVFIITRHFRKG